MENSSSGMNISLNEIILNFQSQQFKCQGIFWPSLGAEFWPHSQSKIATFSPQNHVCFPN